MASPESDLNWKRVFNALSALVTRTNSDSFVIVEERHTKKFVQFCCHAGPELYLDLPQETLSVEEMQRALTYFQRHGVRGLTATDSFRFHPDTGEEEPAGHRNSINMELGGKVRLATQIVFEVFERVYLFPQDLDILITEN